MFTKGVLWVLTHPHFWVAQEDKTRSRMSWNPNTNSSDTNIIPLASSVKLPNPDPQSLRWKKTWKTHEKTCGKKPYFPNPSKNKTNVVVPRNPWPGAGCPAAHRPRSRVQLIAMFSTIKALETMGKSRLNQEKYGDFHMEYGWFHSWEHDKSLGME